VRQKLLLSLLISAALLGACATQKQQDTTKKDPEQLATLNVQLAIEYMKAGKFEVALAKLERALDYDSNSVAAHATLGILYSRIGELDKAERHYSKAVKLAPSDPSVYNNFGQFLCSRGRIDEGLKMIDRALEFPLYRTPALAWTNAGICELSMGRTESAEQNFRAALKIDPAFAPALLQMIRISVKNEDFLSGRAYLQRYSQVGEQTAVTLWLGVQIERELGDKDTAASYGLALKSRFREWTTTSCGCEMPCNRSASGIDTISL